MKNNHNLNLIDMLAVNRQKEKEAEIYISYNYSMIGPSLFRDF